MKPILIDPHNFLPDGFRDFLHMFLRLLDLRISSFLLRILVDTLPSLLLLLSQQPFDSSSLLGSSSLLLD